METLWLPANVVELMTAEAHQKAPLETGGLLAGYLSEDDRSVVVTDVVGPGPNALHQKRTYRPDYFFHREEIGRIFDENNGKITYLGDWHTHPGAPAYLSWTDKKAFRNIARNPDNYIDAPSMLIWGGTDSTGEKEWIPEAWRINRLQRKRFWPMWEFIPLEIRLYEIED